MPSQAFFDALAAVVFPGLASIHLLVALLALLHVRAQGFPRFWYLIPVYVLLLSIAFTALALGFGPPAVLDVTTARNWARVVFGGVFVALTTFTVFYLTEQFRRK